MATHLRVLGWLYLVTGGLFLLGGLVLASALTGTGLIAGDLGLLALLGGLGTFLGILMAALGLPGLLLGYGLLQRRSWARVLGLILGFLNLLNFPVGTLLGAYTLWVLFQPESQALLEGERVAALRAPR